MFRHLGTAWLFALCVACAASTPGSPSGGPGDVSGGGAPDAGRPSDATGDAGTGDHGGHPGDGPDAGTGGTIHPGGPDGGSGGSDGGTGGPGTGTTGGSIAPGSEAALRATLRGHPGAFTQSIIGELPMHVGQMELGALEALDWATVTDDQLKSLPAVGQTMQVIADRAAADPAQNTAEENAALGQGLASCDSIGDAFDEGTADMHRIFSEEGVTTCASRGMPCVVGGIMHRLKVAARRLGTPIATGYELWKTCSCGWVTCIGGSFCLECNGGQSCQPVGSVCCDVSQTSYSEDAGFVTTYGVTCPSQARCPCPGRSECLDDGGQCCGGYVCGSGDECKDTCSTLVDGPICKSSCTCGGRDEAACVDKAGTKSCKDPDLTVTQDGSCHRCKLQGDPCCDGTCGDGLACDLNLGICVPCGGDGQPCCSDFACSDDAHTCSGLGVDGSGRVIQQCVPCGDNGQPACASGCGQDALWQAPLEGSESDDPRQRGYCGPCGRTDRGMIEDCCYPKGMPAHSPGTCTGTCIADDIGSSRYWCARNDGRCYSNSQCAASPHHTCNSYGSCQ